MNLAYIVKTIFYVGYSTELKAFDDTAKLVKDTAKQVEEFKNGNRESI